MGYWKWVGVLFSILPIMGSLGAVGGVSPIVRRIQVVSATPQTIRVGVLDTGFNPNFTDGRIKLCATGHFDVTSSKEGIYSTDPHGSLVAQALAEKLINVDYCLIIVTMNIKGMSTSTAKGIKYLMSIGVNIINLSINGDEVDYEEMQEIQNFASSGGKLFIAAGNEDRDLNQVCLAYPSCYGVKGTMIVGALTDGKRAEYSNYGNKVLLWEEGTIRVRGKDWNGTSFATPRAVSRYVRYLGSRAK